MSAFLDTNVLIRHLTGDPPGQARQATGFLERAEELLVPDLIVAEAYLVASAEASGIGTVASFDRAIDRVATVRRVEPT